MQGFSFEAVKTQYHWPVTIEFPVGVDDNGEPEFAKRQMVCTFNLLPKSEVNEILSAQFTDEDADRSLLKRIFAGWKDGQVKDETGQVLPPTKENIDRFLELPFVQRPVILAYFASLGGQKARRKN